MRVREEKSENKRKRVRIREKKSESKRGEE